MTLKKVLSGEPFVVPADTWNAFIDAANAHRNNEVNTGREAVASSMPSTTVIHVKNNTEDELKRFDVVGIVKPLFKKGEAGSIDLKNLLAFETFDPSDTNRVAQGVVILLEDIAAGAVGKAAASGICYARLLTTSGSVPYAYPNSDHKYKLVENSHGGPFRVLWHDDIDPNIGPDRYQEVDAVVAFDSFDELLISTTFIRILKRANEGGLYPEWETVKPELADDGKTILWKRQFHKSKDELLFEANLLETVEPDTVVTAYYMGRYHEGEDEYKIWIFNHGAVAQGGGVGFGVPAEGQSNIPYSEDIELTVTDAAGEPIRDEFDNIQTIKVWRNAARRAVYTDFSANTIFTYVRFQETPTGHRGCIFSRTESFRSHGSRLPSDGIDVEDSGKQPTLSIDATGDPDNAEHIHVRGNMYFSQAGGFAPWIVMNAKKIGAANPLLDGTIHTDTTAVTPTAGDMIVARATSATGEDIPTVVWDRLGIGATQSVLFVSADGPTWLAPGSDAVLTAASGNLTWCDKGGDQSIFITTASGFDWLSKGESQSLFYVSGNNLAWLAPGGTAVLTCSGGSLSWKDAGGDQALFVSTGGGFDWFGKGGNASLLSVSGGSLAWIPPGGDQSILYVSGESLNWLPPGGDAVLTVAGGRLEWEGKGNDQSIFISTEDGFEWLAKEADGSLLSISGGSLLWLAKGSDQALLYMDGDSPAWFLGAGMSPAMLIYGENGLAWKGRGFNESIFITRDSGFDWLSPGSNGSLLTVAGDRLTWLPKSHPDQPLRATVDGVEWYNGPSGEITMVTDVRVNGLSFEKKTRTLAITKGLVTAIGSESAWTAFHTGTECPE